MKASIEAVKQCVVAGMGVSVLPRIAVAVEVEAGRLANLAWEEPFEVYTQLVWNDRRVLPPVAQALIAVARDAFGITSG